MPGAGRSGSTVVKTVGAIVALIAAIGYGAFGWSFNSSGTMASAAIGIVAAVLAIGWIVYTFVLFGQGR